MRSSLVLVATAAVSLSVNALAQNTFSPITPPGRATPAPAFPTAPSGPPGAAPGYPTGPSMPRGAAPANQPGMVQSPSQGNPRDEAMSRAERQDFGVAPTRELHNGPMHAPTPNAIPGGQVITTPGLVALLQMPQVHALVFDVLGGPETLPNAIPAVAASQGGSLQDGTEQGFGQYLQQVTQGRRDTPLVFYCLSPHCWMSYNASLRAINLGYTNVLWYRGGIEAWKQAGERTQAAQSAVNAPATAPPQGGAAYAPPGDAAPQGRYPQAGGYPQGGGAYQQAGSGYPQASGSGGYPQTGGSFPPPAGMVRP